LLLAPIVAVALSAMQRYPLGSIVKNRVDAWLIPWVAVLLALALTDITNRAPLRRVARQFPRGLSIAIVAVAAVLYIAGDIHSATGYVPTRAHVAIAALTRASQHGNVTYIVANDWPVDLVLPGRITIVTDHNSETDFSVVPPPPYRTLHDDNATQAASELRPACGHTVTVVGITAESLRSILQHVGCPFTIQAATTNGTRQPHDDIVTVNMNNG
jgi:hypothetical protein